MIIQSIIPASLRLRFAVMALFSVLAGVCGTAAAEEATSLPNGITVSVLLFSGRPNPTYHIRDQQLLDQLTKLLRAAPENQAFDKATVVPSILGYNGVAVENDGKIPGLPRILVVYRGNIESRNGKPQFFKDDGGNIERFLLDQALAKNVIDRKTLEFAGALK